MFENTDGVIDDQAAAWAARTMSGSMTKEEENALEAWLLADQRHRIAYDEYMHISERASIAADVTAEESLENELESLAAASSARQKWYVAVPALAASVAAVAFLVNIILVPSESYLTYATMRGENKTVDLADGTMIALNTNTEIEVLIDANQRSVRLIKGEALFDVARDPKRRFVVTSETAQTSVLGTRFNFYEKPGGTIVSVLSGVVEVGSAENDSTPVTLIAGQEVAITQARPEIREFQPNSVTSWQRGLSYHENAPLSQVVADLNRYFDTELVIGDGALNDIPVTGGFDVRDQAVAIESLNIALSLRAEETSTNKVVLFSDE